MSVNCLAFPEKESSLLTKLKKTKPQLDDTADNDEMAKEKKSRPTAVMSSDTHGHNTVCLYYYFSFILLLLFSHTAVVVVRVQQVRQIYWAWIYRHQMGHNNKCKMVLVV
jgi:hypothetical protein